MSSPITDDYYALLGVHAAADDEELRRAWRQLAAQWHPDRAGPSATATFQQLSAAYAVLSDPVARAVYDRGRRSAKPTHARPPRSTATSSPPPRQTRAPAPAIMLERLCGSLTSLLACGAVQLDQGGFFTLVLREAEAKQGGMVSISMPVELRCPDCPAQKRPIHCRRCGGSGIVEELFSAWLAIPPGVSADEMLCPTVELPDMVEPIRFRVRLSGANTK